MAIYYVDYENGNDSNDGSTFSARKKTISSASQAASAGDTVRLAKSPDPTSLGNGTIVDPHLSIYNTRSISSIIGSTTTGETTIQVGNHNCSTGDIIEIWNNSDTTFRINGIYEVTVVNSSTLKLNNYNAGTTNNTSGGYFKVISGKCIKLASAPVKNIAAFAGGTQRTAWVASANVTTSLYSQYGDWSSTRPTMQGGYSDQIEIADGFTTGKAAYYTLPSALDLSGYQQLSLHIHQYSGTKVAAGNYSLRLCSDTTGDTPVNTFTIRQPGQTSGTNSDPFMPITVDLATNLGSSIQSIALYVDSDQGAQNIRMCNIIACKAKSSDDSLTLSSLVGRNSTTVDDQKFWYTIEAIEGDGKIIVVGPTGRTNYAKTSYYYSQYGAWFGDTGGTYTFYKRECFDTSVDDNATSNSTVVQEVRDSGSSGNKITISGGWDPADSMTTRNGLSFYDGIHSRDGRGLDIQSRNYITIENIGMFRYYDCFFASSCNHLAAKNCFGGAGGRNTVRYNYVDYAEDIEFYVACAGQSQPIYFSYCDYWKPKADGYIRKLYSVSTFDGPRIQYCGVGGRVDFDTVWCVYFTNHAYFQYNYGLLIDYLTIPEGNTYSSHGSPRFQYDYGAAEIGTLTAKNLYYGGIYTYQEKDLTVNTYNFSHENAYGWSGGVYASHMDQSTVKILGGSVTKTFYLTNSSELYLKDVSSTQNTFFNVYGGSKGFSRNHDGVSGAYYNQSQYAKLESDTTTRRTASGLAWKATMTSTSAGYGSGYSWDVAKVAVQANSLMTANIYVNRTGTGIHGGLKIRGGQLAGFASTEAYCMGSAGSWEQVTVSGTPTEDGIITIQAEAYYESSTSDVLYFDDFSVTQA